MVATKLLSTELFLACLTFLHKISPLTKMSVQIGVGIASHYQGGGPKALPALRLWR